MMTPMIVMASDRRAAYPRGREEPVLVPPERGVDIALARLNQGQITGGFLGPIPRGNRPVRDKAVIEACITIDAVSTRLVL